MPGSTIGPGAIRSSLIAPCGMNCALCRAYVREHKPCPGCRGVDDDKPKTRVLCPIKTCKKMAASGMKFCFGCDTFPCADLRRLDGRYGSKYGMSMVDNLIVIGTLGIRHFVREEKKKWSCPGCLSLICVHEPRCLSCHRAWRE